MLRHLSLFFISFASFFSFTQDIDFSFTVTGEVWVCQEEVSFEVTAVNNTGALLSGVFCEVQLPEGIIYSSGSLNEITDHGMVEDDVSESSALQFNAGNIGIGDSLKFQISFYAKMPALDFQASGGVFRNAIIISHDGGFEAGVSESYNILYPSLSIVDMTPTSQTVLSGDTTTRSFKIVNAGFGRTDKIYITDVFTTGASLVSANYGSIVGDTIVLTGADFTSIGDGDSYFENNESIVIEESIAAYSCSDITSSSTIKAFWGCEGPFDYSASNYAHVSVDFQSPSIKLIANEELNACFGNGTASVQQVKLVNRGSGIANNIELDVFKSSGSGYDETIFSRFDEASFTYKVGEAGTATAISPSETFSTTGTGDYACLGAGPIGRVKLDLPAISPGDTLIVEWDMYSCCITTCDDDKVKGWSAEVGYKDVCDMTTYSAELDGQGTNSQLMSFFTETPTDIYAGETEEYSFIVSSFTNTLPENENSEYVIEFTLEDGLYYEGINFGSNGVSWVPAAVSYDEGTNIVTARFPVPVPFTLPKSELNLEVSGDCGASGWKSITMNVFYDPDNTCEGDCLIPMVCDLSVTTYLHCPLVSCTGLQFLSYTAARINFGAPDNDFNGLADASGEIDLSKVKTNRAMVGDTVLSVASGVVHSSGTTWAYGKLTSTNDHGVNLDFLSATVHIYDQSSATTYDVTGLPATTGTSGTSKSFTYDLSAGALEALNPALTGFTFDEGDSLSVSAKYEVVSSVAGLIKETLWENDFYLSSVAAPTESEKKKCDTQFARFTLIGYAWRNDNGNNNTIRSCSKKISQNIGMSIGDCCSNYGGGNLFPNEYRHWGYIKEAKVVIPDNYELVNTLFRQIRTKRTNVTNTQNKTSIEPDAVIGDTLYYDLEQYYESGDIHYGDDGFHGILQVELAPNCDVPINTYEPVEWFFNYQKSAAIDAEESGYISGADDNVRYVPSSLSLSSSSPWVDANTREVEWNLKIQNTSNSDADYTWIHVDAPENLVINGIRDNASGDLLSATTDIFLAGTVNDGSARSFTILGTITNCDTLHFDVYAGYECVGYPADFASFECLISDIVLYVEPKPSAFQVRLFSEPLLGDVCSPLVEVGVDISSVKIANMYNMKIDLVVPDTNKIKVVSDSSYFKYNMGNPFASIPDPALTDSLYNYTVNDYVPSFELGGIPGVLDLSNNRYQLKTTLFLGEEFLQGDYLQFRISGQNACAVDLPVIYLDYDPNTKFVKDNTAGLHVYSGDTWSASWGDYNNDGFEDLFVPNKNAAEASALYLNNGDGTLTRILEGAVVTDLGESVSATWGDYDNDGDLDLFVANNTFSKNKLYKNNGDGTFDSVTDDPIVDLGTYSHSSSWADYDNDGFLDLVVSDIHPTHYNFLFHNNGDGTFEEVPESPISQTASSAVGLSWADYDNDGDLDLFIANTNGENNDLYRNDAGIFTPIEDGDIVNDGGHSIGGIWGDYDNDMDLDLFVTNSRDIEQNFFYENNGDGTFTKLVSGVVLSNMGNSHGASWIDFDNDGDLDLLVANDQNSKNFLFSNNGDGTFTKLTNAITDEESNSYGTAWADYDNDGDYDLHISNHGGATNDFFINEKGGCNNYFGLTVEGCNSNRSGIGTRIKLKATILGEPVWQMREISSQNSALGGQNSLKTIFGLNDAEIVDSLVVLWPSGLTQVLTNQAVNQVISLYEECGAKLCGYVFYDENGNDVKDEGELGVPNKEILVTPGNITVFTDHEGYYQLYVLDDEYTLTLPADPDWTETYPTGGAGYTIDVNSELSSEYSGNDFATIPACLDPDLTVQVGATAFRRGLTNDLMVHITNEGAFETTEAIELKLKFTENTYLIGEDWVSVATADGYRTYTYTIDPLARLADTLLRLTDSVDATVSLDDVVSLEARIEYLGDECDVENNEATVFDVVVGSIDPNDKQVLVMNKGVVRQVELTDTIRYKIRFQNVGNYAARRVLISDTLSPHLDLSSITILESSHPFSVSITNNVITWVNNNIELPDSTSDLEGSNGSVSFSVVTKKNSAPFTSIENKASIQFDYNEFITTNNTILVTVPKAKKLDGVYIYPNPAGDQTEVLILDGNSMKLTIASVHVLDANGKVMINERVDYNRCELNTSSLDPGSYIVKVYAADNNAYYGKLIVR